MARKFKCRYLGNPSRLDIALGLVLTLFFSLNHIWMAYAKTKNVTQRRIVSRQVGADTSSRLNGTVVSFDEPCILAAELERAARPIYKLLQTSIRDQLDIRMSKLYIIGKKSVYKVGDVAEIRINLYSSAGVLRTTGGDRLKVRIFETNLNASAACYVTDHQNGSYTASVKLLWSGTPSIDVFLVQFREAGNAFDVLLKRVKAFDSRYVEYNNGEEGRCYPFKQWFVGSRPICDMTERNGGMSWFCHAPLRTSCDEVKQFGYCKSAVYSQRLIKRLLNTTIDISTGKLLSKFKLKVKGNIPNEATSPSKVPCSLYNRTKLWTLPSPVGYFFKNKWTLLHCTPASQIKIETCLRDKRIVLYGDSTVRQWFVELKEIFRCELTSEAWAFEKWIFDSTLYCPGNNLTIDLVFHSLPGNVGKDKVEFNSIARHMLKFYKRKETIFLIGIKSHLFLIHKDVFRDRLRHIRESVDIIQEGDPNAMVFVKGGYTNFNLFSRGMEFRSVEYEEYKGILDKVVFLDNLDMTMAGLTRDSHPASTVVRIMVDQMLGYMCV